MVKKSKKEKPETVEVKHISDNSEIRGCFAQGEKKEFVHLGALFIRSTACGKSMGGVILSRDIIVNCPECVAEIRYRAEHPDAGKEKMGVVTHKKK